MLEKMKCRLLFVSLLLRFQYLFMNLSSFLKYYWLLFFCCLISISCKNETPKQKVISEHKTVSYAEGFNISEEENHTIITISNPWPNAEKEFTYAFVKKGQTLQNPEIYDAIVTVPIEHIVVTSTTHIPSLEALGVEHTLVGFPNLDYISSKKTRANISEGSIKELGKNESLNTEVLIDLDPDAVVSFAVDGANKSLQTIKKTGIPVLINADWTETHPLGKAEWIKFFGVLYHKRALADSLFNNIKTNYIDAKKLAQQATNIPTVLSGAMYKDIWYMPQGDSWAARFIEDANGAYLWKESKGTGSISLNVESVLEKGQQANFWIGPGQFTSKQQLLDANKVYGQFDAFKNNKVFSFTNKKGATGGVVYYELAPNRPDLVLKDIIKILHPSLLPEYQPYFFTHIE